MFAGLPGMGLGTLFYVLIALFMPVYELVRLIRGNSSAERWRVVVVQFSFAVGIIMSIAIADRVLLAALGAASPDGMSVATFIHDGLAARAPASLLASPLIASLLLLGGILVSTEVLRLIVQRRERLPVQSEESDPASLDSYSRPAA
jgi:hypothetical protein